VLRSTPGEGTEVHLEMSRTTHAGDSAGNGTVDSTTDSADSAADGTGDAVAESARAEGRS
jgi:hypothetical protein